MLEQSPTRQMSARAAVDAEAAADPLLVVNDLTVEFPLSGGRVLTVVDGVSFVLRRGDIFGIVGESGSGKTTLCTALVGALPPPGRVSRGSILLDGTELVG